MLLLKHLDSFIIYIIILVLSIGMTISHLGVGFLILGITSSSIWQKEIITKMKINDETKIEKYNIVFDKINEINGPNYLAIQGNFLIYP